MKRDQETRRGLVVASMALVVSAASCAFASGARAQDIGQALTFAGSVQESYLFVPTNPEPTAGVYSTFVTEASLKLSADVGEHVSGQVKVCFGCHGFELGMAFADFHVNDQFNVRVGRFSPSFGEFPLRHDPANHRTVDKPLAYDMGRMLRPGEWNLGILPIPYVDHGLEVNGTHWFDESVQFDYAAYIVGGLRGQSNGFDVDWIESRSIGRYYVDNNNTPAGGGRLGMTWHLGEEVTLSLGASGMYGLYDPDSSLSYLIVGADAYARIGALTLRAEYLLRRTRMALGDNPEERFAYGPGSSGRYDPYFVKDGWYFDVEYRVNPTFEIVGRFDGLRRSGNVPVASQLRSSSLILRYTAGVNFIPDRAFRIKLFVQVYDFTDFQDEITIQGALAANF